MAKANGTIESSKIFGISVPGIIDNHLKHIARRNTDLIDIWYVVRSHDRNPLIGVVDQRIEIAIGAPRLSNTRSRARPSDLI